MLDVACWKNVVKRCQLYLIIMLTPNPKLLVRLQVDDLLDAFPVHFGGGVMGLLMAPIFTYDGLVYYKGCYEENGEWLGDCNMGMGL